MTNQIVYCDLIRLFFVREELKDSKKHKRQPDGDRLCCSSDGAPTPAGKQSNGDPAATRVAMRLRDCLRKAWAPEGRAI
ncbi:hypothetical protein [Exiguobacterium sp. s7]|uniref:hypothetical protein n=1 Tax=Exiguobacterium sp. s7 TaxID=2751235 RepID=UPI001BE6A913|nr:hypothetical protein [Exiguobacterium sp. s7]